MSYEETTRLDFVLTMIMLVLVCVAIFAIDRYYEVMFEPPPDTLVPLGDSNETN
jgi:hypothetical protein